jgi:hypothetical protein
MFNMRYKKAMSGLTVTDAESEAFKKLLPSIDQTIPVRRQKILDALEQIKKASIATRQTLGVEEMIEVKDKDGNLGVIPEGEFDPNLYTKN